MVKITQSERVALEKVGLLRHKRIGYNSCDPNFYVANKEHMGRNKHTYIVEDPEVMKFLGRYEGLNLQRINASQYESLVEAGLLTDKNIQKWGQYNAKAICFESPFGEYRISKIASLMMFLGLWKDNKRKRMAKNQAKKEVRNEIESDNLTLSSVSPTMKDFIESSNSLGENSLGENSLGENSLEENFVEPTQNQKPNINEQAKQLGMPKVIFRDTETGEVVASGGYELLGQFFTSAQNNQ